MLTVFHTADWHLGQTFCGFDRDDEHGRFLDWLLAELQMRRPDALIVAGDVFDTINPSAAAQRRLYSFLAAAHDAVPQLNIVLTAGNHDAGARLEAPRALLDSLNISVVGTVKRDDNGDIDPRKLLVPLTDAAGNVKAIVMAVPFLRPSDVPLLPSADDAYPDGIRELYRMVTDAAVEMRDGLCPDAALLAMGHCHLQGGDESRDSERRLVIGGVEAVSADAFDPRIAYVALGHLHKAQQFQNGRIRYSGSPIPLSFSESRYAHQVLQVTFENTELRAVEPLPVPRSTPLLRVPADGAALIDEVLAQLAAMDLDDAAPPEQHPFLEVRVLEDGPDPLRRKRIEDALENRPVRLASIKLETASRPADESFEAAEAAAADLRTIDPEDIFLDAYREKYDSEPDAAVVAAFREILLGES